MTNSTEGSRTAESPGLDRDATEWAMRRHTAAAHPRRRMDGARTDDAPLRQRPSISRGRVECLPAPTDDHRSGGRVAVAWRFCVGPNTNTRSPELISPDSGCGGLAMPTFFIERFPIDAGVVRSAADLIRHGGTTGAGSGAAYGPPLPALWPGALCPKTQLHRHGRWRRGSCDV